MANGWFRDDLLPALQLGCSNLKNSPRRANFLTKKRLPVYLPLVRVCIGSVGTYPVFFGNVHLKPGRTSYRGDEHRGPGKRRRAAPARWKGRRGGIYGPLSAPSGG